MGKEKCGVCGKETSILIDNMKGKDIIKYLSMGYKYNKVLYDISGESYLYCSHVDDISNPKYDIKELVKEYISSMQINI